MTDVFTFPYTAVQLTQQVNRIPNVYGLLNELNVFPSQGSISTLVEVRREEYTLAVLPAADRGATGSVASRKPGDALFFDTPHFPHKDTLRPQDLQNQVQQVANTLQPRTFEVEMAKRLWQIRAKHAITREWLRMSALKGIIMDGAGNVLYNLFTQFGFTPVTIYFNLASNSSDVIGACAQLIQGIQTNLRGEVMSHVRVFVDPTFFNQFVNHPNVNKYWLNWQAASELANMQRVKQGGQFGRTFPFQQIEWVEYYGSVPVKQADGTLATVPLISPGLGHAYPVGTMSTFGTWDAPPNHIQFVNTPGTEVFISPKVLDHGQGVELHTESNPLPLCKRPEVLVTVSAAAAPTS